MIKQTIFLLLFLCSKLISHETQLDRHTSLFSRLPNWQEEAVELTPFGEGMTNQNYLLKIGQTKYFVRDGSGMREPLGTSFDKELQVVKIAAQLNLSPAVLMDDPTNKILVMPFIASTQLNLRDEKPLSETIKLIKKFHQSNVLLPHTLTPEQSIAFYLEELKKLEISLSPEYQAIVDHRPHPKLTNLVPCHLDLNSRNVLDDGNRFWIIDWEYGAMSDPYFDLAALASADFFTDEAMAIMLSFYETSPTKEQVQRLKEFRILADIRWGLWCLLQMECSDLDFPFEQDAQNFFDQAKLRLFPENGLGKPIS